MEKRYTGPIPGRRLCFTLDQKDRKEYCCLSLTLHTQEKNNTLVYVPQFREYAVKVSDCILQTIRFCPWCGSSFSEPLHVYFFDILQREYGIEADAELENVPDEFQSDEWWKRRGF